MPALVSATRDPRLVRLVWIVAAVGLLPIVGLVAVTGASGEFGGTLVDLLAQLALAMGLAAFVLSGALIVVRQPGNVVGWLLILPGMSLPTSELASYWLRTLDPLPTQVTPALWVLVSFTSWSWLLLIIPIFHLLLTLPSGRLLSPRWRPAVLLEAGMIGTMFLLTTFSATLTVLDGTGGVLWSLPNPIGFLPPEVWSGTFDAVWSVLLLTATVVSVAAFIVRFRRGTPNERRQLKWPLLAVALFGPVYGLSAIGATFASNVLFAFAIAFIPISVAIAVTRYRLYDIDRIVSRTVSWFLVTALIGGVFAIGIVLLSALLEPVTGDDTIAVAAATLAAAALFQPIRTWIQRAVDRYFNRSRYDQERIADAFASEIRGDADVVRLIDLLRGTLDSTVEPSAMGIWLRAGHARLASRSGGRTSARMR